MPRTRRILIAALTATLPAIAANAQQEQQQPEMQPLSSFGLPELEYEPIAKYDAEGAIIPVIYPAPELATWVNPMLSAEDRANVEAIVIDRRLMHAESVITSLSIIEAVDRGALESITVADPSTLTDAQEYLAPFQGNSELNSELMSLGVLTTEQAQFNQYIANAYYMDAMKHYQKVKKAEAEAAGETPAQDLDLMTRYYITASLEDELLVYHMLLEAVNEYRDEISSILGGAVDPEKLIDNLDGATAALAEAPRHERITAIRDALDDFDLEQRRIILSAAVNYIPTTSRPAESDEDADTIEAIKIEPAPGKP